MVARDPGTQPSVLRASWPSQGQEWTRDTPCRWDPAHRTNVANQQDRVDFSDSSTSNPSDRRSGALDLCSFKYRVYASVESARHPVDRSLDPVWHSPYDRRRVSGRFDCPAWIGSRIAARFATRVDRHHFCHGRDHRRSPFLGSLSILWFQSRRGVLSRALGRAQALQDATSRCSTPLRLALRISARTDCWHCWNRPLRRDWPDDARKPRHHSPYRDGGTSAL